VQKLLSSSSIQTGQGTEPLRRFRWPAAPVIWVARGSASWGKEGGNRGEHQGWLTLDGEARGDGRRQYSWRPTRVAVGGGAPESSGRRKQWRGRGPTQRGTRRCSFSFGRSPRRRIEHGRRRLDFRWRRRQWMRRGR
jgi:hypothetical protein